MRAEIKHVGDGKVKVVIYVRVSTQEQANEGYSIGEQIERLNKYCEAMGWVIVETYVDPGYSGGSTDRPALQKMIKDLEAGDVDKVVVYKLDRLSRSQKDTLFLIEDVFLKHNTDFVSMNENFDTSTPFGRAMIGILAVFAQLEREQIKERMSMGREARAKEGKWRGGGNVPTGYDYIPSEDALVVNEYERMQVRELYDLFLKGMPLNAIETLFREKGYRRKTGGEWQTKEMRYLMSNKLYLGLIHCRGEWCQGAHEALIDEETFNKAVALLDERAVRFKESGLKPGTYTTYLGGLIWCKRCGARFTKQKGGKKSRPIYYYVCYSRNKKVRKMITDPNCKNETWRVNDLDSLIFEEIKKLALDPEYATQAAQEKKKTAQEEPDNTAVLQAEIEKIDEQISRFMALYGIGKIKVEQISKHIDPLNEQRDALSRELERVSGNGGKITVEEAVEIAKSFDDILERGNFDETRAVIESLIDRIELDGDTADIHWKFL